MVSEITGKTLFVCKKMLKNGVFWAGWEQVGVQVGPKLGASRQMSEGSGQLKRGDLRAYLGSVEGLYPLEGEMRNMGVSEGFAGKVESVHTQRRAFAPL